MTEPKVAISQDFLTAYAQIPRAQQKKVMEFVTKFRYDPRSSGINYEKIQDARDPNMRSVRIDQAYRGIVLSPKTGDVYVLLWVDKHDDAYAWARRHRCDIHPETGTLQVIETVEQQQSEPSQSASDEGPTEGEGPIPPLRDRELLSLGVPEQHLPLIRSCKSEPDLEALEQILPREAFEALYLLAAGASLEEVQRDYAVPTTPVDTADFATALDRDQSRSKFRIIEDDAELQEMLNAPLEQWRVFLHPVQRRLVEWRCNGPIRVLGGAGTGKTVVAMHRAVWLVRNVVGPERKVLFTTFTANLAVDIEENLKKICRPQELERLEVVNIDAWVSRFLKRQSYPHRLVYSNDPAYEGCWRLALDNKPPEPSLPDSFFREEWERVILPQRVGTRADYLRARRTGRGIALNRRQRSAIWPVFEELLIQMHQQGLRTPEQAALDAADRLDQGRVHLPYDAAVVDEAQDMGPEAIRLIRSIVPPGPNDLFLVGDGHQRIYRRRYALSHCGIEVRGRSRRLKINYRTTEETRRFAVSVLQGQAIDDLDDGADQPEGYRSLMHGQPPVVEHFSCQADELDWMANELEAIKTDRGTLRHVCVVARTQKLVDQYQKGFESRGLNTVKVSRREPDHKLGDGVRLATMHRVKGLEFHYVFMAAMNEGYVPLKNALESTTDQVERRSTELNERALFHVAASRAIKALYVSSFDKKSPFLRG